MSKGLILAGGRGTRLLPITEIINKHLVSILNKPMIMYPLETLKSFGIKDIMIVSGGDHIGGIAEFLGDGSRYDVNLTYRVQKEAGGIAQALGLAKDFVGNDKVFVILGDNVFDNSCFKDMSIPLDDRAVLFVKSVSDPERFGVISEVAGVKFIEEKPKNPKSTFAVTGLYVYPPKAFDIVPTLKPSARGEIEITDLNNFFLNEDLCDVIKIDGFWSDAGTVNSLKRTIDWVYEKGLTNS